VPHGADATPRPYGADDATGDSPSGPRSQHARASSRRRRDEQGAGADQSEGVDAEVAADPRGRRQDGDPVEVDIDRHPGRKRDLVQPGADPAFGRIVHRGRAVASGDASFGDDGDSRLIAQPLGRA